MAGPGQPGPAFKDDPERQQLEKTVLTLHDRNFSYRQIAKEVDLHWTTVGEMVRRIDRRTLSVFDRSTVRSKKLRQIHRIQDSLEPRVINVHGVDDFVPDLKAAAELLKAISAERQLMGADAPTRIEIAVGDDGADVATSDVGDDDAERTERFMDLADLIAGPKGYGSGRIIDAEVVEDDEQNSPDLSPNNRVRGPGSDAPQLEAGPIIEAGPITAEEVVVADPNDGVDDDPIGVWRDGKFYPASADS